MVVFLVVCSKKHDEENKNNTVLDFSVELDIKQNTKYKIIIHVQGQ